MRFGLFGGARIGKANPLGDSQGYRDFIEYVKCAEQLGFHSVFLVEHHFTGHGQLSASLNLLSYLAACTSRMRLGTAVVVLPWHNPALLAEQVATLDVLSGGRVDFGVGRGYRKNEYEAFCIPMEEGWERFNECMEFLLEAWRSPGRFSHHGKRWHYHDIVVEPPPVQKPHPPIWMAAGSPDSIARVAAGDYNLLLDQLGSIDQTIDRLELYLDGLEKIGRPRDAGRVGVTRGLTIVRTEAERRTAYERRRETLKNIGELARPPVGAQPQSYADVDIASDDAALIGTPEEIVERLNRLAAGGVEYVLLTNSSATAESLALFAERIMPHVSGAKATPARTPAVAGS